MTLLICPGCGQHLYDEQPPSCPLCRSPRDRFLSAAEADRRYRVAVSPVTGQVQRLAALPPLGVACYRVATDLGPVWIDCPCAFDPSLEPVDAILFCHPDFMGATNRYRELWGSEVYLNELDTTHRFARGHVVDRPACGDYTRGSLEAYHLGGHTPGFTMFIHGDVLFAGDYVFLERGGMRLTPFGDPAAIRKGARRILELTEDRALATACGYNYVTDFRTWRQDLARILA